MPCWATCRTAKRDLSTPRPRAAGRRVRDHRPRPHPHIRRSRAAGLRRAHPTGTAPPLARRRGWRLTVCEVDPRPGGAWRFGSTGPAGAEMELHGLFRQVVPPVRLIQTEIHRD
ncbi:SRPBCC domain-containing protein [Actinomadura sp. 9N215]|uniref:SRPBCC domain-containing protein n=1 Tax=Actinomadura sp. 9N215 TaxID=3375150 RepID=UPI0037B813B7